MGNVKKLFRIMLKYWKLMLAGFLTMSIFAVVSGMTVTMFVPLFDFVFGAKHKESLYTTASEFLEKAGSVTGRFFSSLSFSGIFEGAAYLGLLEDLKEVLSLTDPNLLLILIGAAMIILMVLKNSIFFLNRVIFISLRGKVIRLLRNVIFRKFLDIA